MRIYDGARQIMELDGTWNAGLNSVRWNLNGQREAGAADAAGSAAGGGGQIGYTVGAGEFRVVLMVGGKEYTQRAIILPDPGK